MMDNPDRSGPERPDSLIAEQTSAQVLFFLYELAKVFSSSLDLDEVAEYILDGACALIGAEEGFLCALSFETSAGELTGETDDPVLHPYAVRNLSLSALQQLAPLLQPVWNNREGIKLKHTGGEDGDWEDMLAAPLIVRDQVVGVLGVLTATARPFTAYEQDRLDSVANLGALALENARLHDHLQREVQMLRRLIKAARQMGEGRLSPQQIAELESSLDKDEISHLSQVFAQMARQVIEREDILRQKVRDLEIRIDASKRDRQIAEITDTEYFQHIQQRAAQLRENRSRK